MILVTSTDRTGLPLMLLLQKFACCFLTASLIDSEHHDSNVLSGIMTVQQSRMRRFHWSNVLSVPPSLQRMLEAPPRLQWTIPPRTRPAAIQHKLLTNSNDDHDCDSSPSLQGFINSETAVRPEHAGRTQFFEGLLHPRLICNVALCCTICVCNWMD